MEERAGQIEAALGGKLDADKVTVNTAITQGGYAADARQLNPTIGGTLAHSVVGLLNRIGNIYVDTYVTDVRDSFYVPLPIKTTEVLQAIFFAFNGDTNVWGGYVVGTRLYGGGEYVEARLSEVHSGPIRINYIYVHS